MRAATLHCPDCGAPASPDARECGYCHARLATVKCPACFGAAFVGMRHCPACGAALAREEVPDEEVKLACPRCAGALQPIRLGPSRLRECDGCGGLWVDNRTFLAICRDRERQAALPSARAGDPPPESLELPVAYLACPVCRVLMNRVNFARVSGVVVDVCREHGTWFGRGELQRVVEFLGRGGLPRAVTRVENEAFDLFLRGGPAASGDPLLAIFAPFIPDGGG
jgi:Zn-finger nucleic acid-binding protein